MADLVFVKFNFLVMVRSRLRLVFRPNPVFSKLKFNSAGIQLFGLKTLNMVNLT